MVIGKYNSWPDYNCYIDFIYANLLKCFYRESIINDEIFAEIKKIEQLAYPKHLRAYENTNNLKEYVKLVNCYNARQIDYYLNDGLYLVCIRHYNCVEIYDCASANRKSRNIFTITKFLFDHYYGKDVYVNARESTSYPLFKLFEKRGKIEIVSDNEDCFKGEKFHKMMLRATKA